MDVVLRRVEQGGGQLTDHQLAKELGVSRSTVQRAVAGLVRSGKITSSVARARSWNGSWEVSRVLERSAIRDLGGPLDATPEG